MSQIPEYGGFLYFTCDEVNERCPVEATIYGDYFTLGACIFFVAAYSILLAVQSYFGWRLRSWGFVGCLAAGTVTEFIGYVGRTILAVNPWNFGAFVTQNLMLVLGPTIIAAGISVTFKHLVSWYGSQWSIIRPNHYPWIFVGTDVFSLLVQMAGGGVAAIATVKADQSLSELGNNLMLGGVCFQVVNMIFCGGLILTYAWRRRQEKSKSAHVRDNSAQDSLGLPCQNGFPAGFATTDEKTKLRAKRFVSALVIAYAVIIIRCIYRIPEMSMGWGSDLQKNETTFLVLDGGMVLTSVIMLTVFHPFIFFPYMRKERRNTETAHQGQATEIATPNK